MSLYPLSTPQPTPPLLVLAAGNPSRGDDALAPTLMDDLHGWLAHQPDALARQIEVLVDLQWRVEHAFDLLHRRQILFVDAAVATRSPIQLERVEAIASEPWRRHIDSHQGSPAQLLSICAGLLHTPAPAWLLSVRGDHFDLGAPLSASAQARLPRAQRLLRAWILRFADPAT